MGIVDRYLNRAYQENRDYVFILAFFILVLIIAGIVSGILAIFVKVDWAWIEVFVVPVLYYLIKYYANVTKNNPEILNKASGALDVAKKQDPVAQYIREEKESEKQQGG